MSNYSTINLYRHSPTHSSSYGSRTRNEEGEGGVASSINSVEKLNLESFGVEVHFICFRMCKGLQEIIKAIYIQNQITSE